MKKSLMIVALTLFTIMPTFANSWQSRSTCQKRVSFFGLLTVYSGSVTWYEYDNFGIATGNSFTTQCTADGNWDWIW
ncbi:MAG: hypothetical protein O9282_01660 [Flavobacterium sp.]|jgi:hypothetical protein|uniref:hypothetical protein n=1 Tax=Flavobacterium TaxID=237 RepID=UPI0022C2D900|nr:hypothetical protein [Flavobacterium sp.]MCZ8329999.1 hypothetical protein [Flavobacterium sp.]